MSRVAEVLEHQLPWLSERFQQRSDRGPQARALAPPSFVSQAVRTLTATLRGSPGEDAKGETLVDGKAPTPAGYIALSELVFDCLDASNVTPTRAEARALAQFFTRGIDGSAQRLLKQTTKSLAELEVVFASLPDAVYAGTSEGITRANAPALMQLGYSNLEQLNRNIGTLAEEIQTRRADTGALIPTESQAFSRALRGQPDVQEVKVRHLGTGEERIVRSSCAPVRVEGNVVGAVAINTDITERKHAEDALHERTDFEQHLIGIVSHDLRNPLNVIVLGTAALLQRECLDEATLKSLQRIRSNAERATRLIEDLLDFTQARLGAGIPVDRRAMNLHEVVGRAVEELQIVHAERSIAHRAAGDAIGCWDADRIVQVVNNLVTNAVKYSAANSPIVVRTASLPGQAVLAVHNEGKAIPPELLERIFEPLQRASRGGASSVGLGLYIVKRIVDAHGGRTAVVSNDDEGTTFTVFLPRSR